MRNIFRSLYGKLSLLFLLLLVLVGAVYVTLSVYQSETYFAIANQRINASLAEHIASEVRPFINGRPNTEVMAELFHDVMVVNPAVEVYLLDSLGKVLSYSAPPEKIRLQAVSLEPIHEFLLSRGRRFVVGDNPRDASRPKVFSAAEVVVNDMVYGYIYVILGGEEYDTVAERTVDNQLVNMGLRWLLLSLAATAVIGLAALHLVTGKLRGITKAVMAFKEGDYAQRIHVRGDDEVDQLAKTFNEMAGRIAGYVDELRRTDSLRRELIANVSHDLRTPLASMQGYLETVVMKDSTLSPSERKQYLHTILSSSERLSRLVQELFELSKLEAKETKVTPEPFALPELANDLALKFAPQANQSGVSLTTSIPKGIPLVSADLRLIERVLQNLIDNAIKNTPNGGRIVIEVTTGKEGKVRTAVVDTGIGIPREQLGRIFDRFYQTRRGSSTDGAGLGLAIVKKILEAHGETIAVSSEVGKGTRFEFCLPAALP